MYRLNVFATRIKSWPVQIDNVGSKELCPDLDDTTVLSHMFEVEQSVDHLVCPNVVKSKGFSTGDGKRFVSCGCRGHIQIICSGGEEAGGAGGFCTEIFAGTLEAGVQREGRRHEHRWVKCWNCPSAIHLQHSGSSQC